MPNRILFVDDEPMVLRGIERSLRSMRHEWTTEFAPGGPEALDAMAKNRFDVVITDMRMPGMDGAQLLEEVKNRFPRMVRIVLSGQSDQATILRAIGPTHQYLSKPCDVEELKQKLRHALALRDLLDNSALKEVVSRLAALPSLPALRSSLRDLLNSPNPSIVDAGKIVSRDIGMTAKVLQLVNSAFLGTPSRIVSATKASAIIGLDTLRALTLSVELFFELEPEFAGLHGLWKDSLATARCAQAIARAESAPTPVVEAAFTAGLLCDVGRLVLASACSKDYRAALAAKQENSCSTDEAEMAAFGCTHAQVGAYLLGLWGLPDSIVEAVAWHHEPVHGKALGFCPLVAVHAAERLRSRQNGTASAAQGPDSQYLAGLGLADRLPAWTEVCAQAHATGDKDE